MSDSYNFDSNPGLYIDGGLLNMNNPALIPAITGQPSNQGNFQNASNDIPPGMSYSDWIAQRDAIWKQQQSQSTPQSPQIPQQSPPQTQSMPPSESGDQTFGGSFFEPYKQTRYLGREPSQGYQTMMKDFNTQLKSYDPAQGNMPTGASPGISDMYASGVTNDPNTAKFARPGTGTGHTGMGNGPFSPGDALAVQRMKLDAIGSVPGVYKGIR